MTWEIKTAVFNNQEVTVKICKETDDYIITADPETIKSCKKLYKEGYADLTFGQFIYRLVSGSIPT